MPEEYLADNSLYINIALLFCSLRIAEKANKPIDGNAYTDAVISHSAPFEVEFTPRMEEGRLRDGVHGDLEEWNTSAQSMDTGFNWALYLSLVVIFGAA